jgi:hypothetical protein
MINFTAILQKFDSKLWSHHIVVPQEIAIKFISGTDRRVVCTLNDCISFQCALMPLNDNSSFININKKIRDQLRIHEGSTVQVRLEKDMSQYGLPLPEELSALFEIDEEGKNLFHELTPGKQRTLLYIAGTGKNEETRIRKAIILIEHLKTQKGKIDFKLLYEALKLPK